MGISKTTYYNCKSPEERLGVKYSEIKSSLVNIIEESPKYGVNRLKSALLDDYGIHIGRDALGKLLKVWGLQLKRTIRKNKPSQLQKLISDLGGYSNLLSCTKVEEPFQAISSDITTLNYKGGKAYFCVHKDVYGQVVYGYSLDLDMTRSLVIESYLEAKRVIINLKGDLPIDMMCHQDQGSQYTSYDYVETVQADMILSYSRKGTPTDNPGQESFFGRFKEEWEMEIVEIETFEELKKFITEKMEYYNSRRLHTSLGNKAPMKFTKSHLKS